MPGLRPKTPPRGITTPLVPALAEDPGWQGEMVKGVRMVMGWGLADASPQLHPR